MAQAVDHAEIKTGQLITIAMSLAAFLLHDIRVLIALGLIFLVTALYRPLSPFVWVYRFIVRPIGVMRSDYRLDNIQPHSFGQFIGAVTVMLAVGLLHFDYSIAGWSIVWVLLGLTLMSYAGWCIGCYFYYQLNRLGLGGFFRQKPTDTSRPLGTRPKTRATQDNE